MIFIFPYYKNKPVFSLAFFKPDTIHFLKVVKTTIMLKSYFGKLVSEQD